MDRRIRVLIADDHFQARDGMRALLATAAGLEVVGEAANGLETLRLVEACLPDVVVTDARMGVMDGLEATRRIKSRWPEVRVVVVTMYPDYRREATEAGADDFLVKGCCPERLLEAIGAGGEA